MVELWTSKIGGNVTELSTQGTTTGTGTWLSVTSMRDSTHVYNNGQAAPVHQHSGYKPLHAHGICLTAHTHPSNSTRPKSKHTKSYCQPLTLLHVGIGLFLQGLDADTSLLEELGYIYELPHVIHN